MNKKCAEKECLDKTKAFLPRASKNAKEILHLLDGEVVESERPDFIIKRKDGYFGVEHFLIDTLVGRKKASINRKRTGEISRVYQKYKDSLEGNEESALSDIESIVQEDVDSIQHFNYQIFIKEFDRIIKEHANKADEYRKQNTNLQAVIFLIEIPIVSNRLYGLKADGAMVEIRGEKFPITQDMLRVLKAASDKVDYIIISIMRENYIKRPYMVYAIDSSRFESSVAAQLKDVYLNFTYDWEYKSANAKLELVLAEDKD